MRRLPAAWAASVPASVINSCSILHCTPLAQLLLCQSSCWSSSSSSCGGWRPLHTPSAVNAGAMELSCSDNSSIRGSTISVSNLRHNSSRSNGNRSSSSSSSSSSAVTGSSSSSSTAWKDATHQRFSIRPSVLSPLHTVHREMQDIQARLRLLELTTQAQLKLSEQLQPSELAAQDGNIAAALGARRAALSAVVAAYRAHLEHAVVAPPSRREDARPYYTVLDKLSTWRDGGGAAPGEPPAVSPVEELDAVLRGDRDVWHYWFKTFKPAYDGLPGLSSLGQLYNTPDEAATLRELSKQRPPEQRPLQQEPEVDALGRAAAIGGRKTSRAQVWLWRGSGRILVNKKPLDSYFGDMLLRSHVLQPLSVTNLVGKVDVLVQVDGGGLSGQAQAAGHGIARALRRLDPSLRPQLQAEGLLRRDPRMVERKKPGRAKARKGFAWVKR